MDPKDLPLSQDGYNEVVDMIGYHPIDKAMKKLQEKEDTKKAEIEKKWEKPKDE